MLCEMLKPLTNDNYLVFAMKHYDNPQCKSIEEFHDDLNRTKYLKRLFKKYTNSKVLKERLILNHIIILNNVFGVEQSSRMLFFKIEEEYHSLLKTFLVYLNSLPEKDIPEADLIAIPLNQEAMKILREI